MLRHAPNAACASIFPRLGIGPSYEHRTVYPVQNYMLALYRTQARNRYDDLIVATSPAGTAPAVMMVRDRNLSLSLAANGRQGRRYRPSFASALKGVGANVYVHSLGDPNQIQRFWDRGVGVYSGRPFPPLGGTTALQQEQEETLIMPELPEASSRLAPAGCIVLGGRVSVDDRGYRGCPEGDLNPAPRWFGGRGRGGGCRLTCDSRSPTLTARARLGPAVPDR